MPFTRPQQGKFRPLADAAWKAHASVAALDPKDKRAKDAWYREQLITTTGFSTTSALDSGRDFDVLMAHFESIIDDGSTYWQARADAGDFNRIIWSVFRKKPPVIAGEKITPAYLSGIAKQSLRLHTAPALRTLNKDQLKIVTTALAIHANRAASTR
jgi:hypothetical protein